MGGIWAALEPRIETNTSGFRVQGSATGRVLASLLWSIRLLGPWLLPLAVAAFVLLASLFTDRSISSKAAIGPIAGLIVVIGGIIGLLRPEELIADGDEIVHRPILGTPRSFRWDELHAVQVRSVGYPPWLLLYRFSISAIIVAMVLLLGGNIVLGLAVAAFWISVIVVINPLAISFAPTGDRFSSPGPNDPVTRLLVSVFRDEHRRRVADLILRSAQAHHVPAWSPWNESRRDRPWY